MRVGRMSWSSLCRVAECQSPRKWRGVRCAVGPVSGEEAWRPGHPEFAMGASLKAAFKCSRRRHSGFLGISVERAAGRVRERLDSIGVTRCTAKAARDLHSQPHRHRCRRWARDGVVYAGGGHRPPCSCNRRASSSQCRSAAGHVRTSAPFADEVVCPAMPEPFQGVGLWYQQFAQRQTMRCGGLLSRPLATPGSSGLDRCHAIPFQVRCATTTRSIDAIGRRAHRDDRRGDAWHT